MLHQNLLRRTVRPGSTRRSAGLGWKVASTLGACAAAVALGASPAEAAPKRGPGSCAFSYSHAETLAKAGQLREAKASMLKCATGSCSDNVRKECARRVTEIESDIPTIVPLVVNENGETVTEVTVTMDGELVAARTDGRAVPVDPGRHEFVFQTNRTVLATLRTIIVQGQRNRTIEVSLRPGQVALTKSSVPTAPAPGALAPAGLVEAEDDMVEPAAPDVPPSRGRTFTPTTMILGGVAVLGAGGYFLTTFLGNKDADKLDACRPDCDQKTVDRIRAYFLAGKISLGLGVAALATGAYFYFTSASGEPAKKMAVNRTGLRLDVRPAASGGVALFSGSF